MVVRKGKTYGGPWYSNYREVMIFEKGAKDQFPSLRVANRRGGRKLWREYRLQIDVPEYDISRDVIIEMSPWLHVPPKVMADGPIDSPHRYRDNDDALCMWYPWDPKKNRWVFSDGLLHLLVMIEHHLFREEWWRETGGAQGGEWLGEEVKH